jgi:Xaa-Pro aminopeptidase
MAHYSPTKENCAKIEGSGLLLIDSGAHYLEGTTDITRTFALGNISDEMKNSFTLVLKSHINLAKLRFMKGCKGINLDVIARAPLWQMGLDYNHGTGHGIGYLLSVHEGPNCFRWKSTKSLTEMVELKPGMITSNEPGLYFENKYGIRIESDVLVKEDETNEYGTFYSFDTLTYVPIDLDAINPKLLNSEEKEWLNNYHKKCYELIAPKLTAKEKEWLANYTREI